jgi:shikimate kinase
MNLYLIGYRGSGKSTVAPLLAARLKWNWLDTDQIIQSLRGRMIDQIFAEGQEAEFRRAETSALQSVCKRTRTVVALGGGAPVSEANRQLLASSGRVVWLRAAADVLHARIERDQFSAQLRPSLTGLSPKDEVRQLLAERTSAYEACADYSVDTDKMSPDQIADQIAHWWTSVDK